MINLSFYQATSLEDWQGRIVSDPIKRFHQAIKLLDLSRTHCLENHRSENIAHVGFCCEAGNVVYHNDDLEQAPSDDKQTACLAANCLHQFISTYLEPL